MANKLFVDTNVLIDVITNRQQPHVIYSQRLFAEAYLGNVELYILSLSLVTTIYVARRYGLSEQSVRESLKTLSQFMHIVDMTATDTLAMLDTDWSDYEDAVQDNAAKNIGADYIITGNTRDFARSSKIILTPQQFLEL